MSLTALALEFNDQAKNNKGNITVNAASFTNAGLTTPSDLDVLLQKGYQLADKEYLLINIGSTPVSDPVGDTLTIAGQAAVLNVDAANTAVTFVITDDGSGNAQFTILITLSNWTFSTSWAYMTGGVFSSLPYTSPAFIFSSAKKTGYVWQKNTIDLVAGQNFACLITLTGILQQVTNFLTSWDGGNLALTGMLDPSAVNDVDILFPELDLIVYLGAKPIPLLFLTVDKPAVGFKIITLPAAEDEEDDSVKKLGDDDTPQDGRMEQFISLYFQLQLKIGSNIWVDFTAGITPARNTFFIGVSSDPKAPVTLLDLFALMAGNNWFNILPPTLQQYLNKIAFKSFATSVDFNNGLVINDVSTTVGSNGKWVLFDDFVINEFDVRWLVLNPGTASNKQLIFLSASVDFWKDVFDGTFDVEITSDLTLTASFTGEVTFGKLVSGITLGAIKVPDNLAQVVVFTGFGVGMDINNKTYSFNATTQINIDFITPNISVTNGYLLLTSSSPTSGEGKSIFTATVLGLFAIGSLQLNVYVNYSSSADDGGWDLSVVMPEGDFLDLGELMKKLFEAISLPSSFLPDNLLITQLALKAYIPNAKDAGSSYEVKTGIDWKFTFPIIEQKIEIIATLWIKYESVPGQASGKYSGGVMGTIMLDYFNAVVNIGYDFSDNNQRLMIQWEGFIAEYDVTGQSRTIKFSIKDWTLGGLLTSFMKMLFDPTFELDAPWDILNDISLNGFNVVYNLDTKEVKVNYPLPKTLNLIFITINGITLTKNDKGVFISFDGASPIPSVNESNLFKPQGGGQDVKKMPEVPGQGNEYFDLRLLAMGQHVSLTDPAQYNSVKDVTDAMQKAFTEPENGKIPVGPGSGNSLLYFNEDSNWLIATSFGILNVAEKGKTPVWTIDMQIVFNDPNLYGLYIALSGAKAKVLAGLKFEILYKKISDSIGVYQIDLTLPDVLRNLQFGAVNITLPSISLEIYTNGDFLVDVGFPYNMDFSRSFTLQAIVPPGIPAMGSGGFYFGKLSSATTNKVPATSYGNFNPVIVFGIGLQVGVGYSVNYGILKAGFSLTLFGIIEGVIAAYHPYSGQLQESNPQAVETSYYYYLRGTIGIIGKLYGSIDFGIISASVNITIMVYVQATFEAYNKIPLSIVASVDVSVAASLNLGIFSITIHFSFSATIRQDVTIGTDRTAEAPWNRDLSLNAQSFQAAAFVPAASPRLRAGQERTSYKLMLAAEPEEVLPELKLYFVPHLTVAGPENGNLNSQQAQYVATLFIDAPNPDPSAPAGDPSSFEYLSADFFRWLIQNYLDPALKQATRAMIDAQGVSKEDLDQLVALLSNENNPFPIPTAQLLNFLKTSFKEVNVQLLTANLPSAAIFPMFFDLGLNVPGIPLTIDFSKYNMATTDYLDAVKKWFAELAVQVAAEAGAPAMKAANVTDSYSLSTFVFEDYFVLIGKQLAGFAADAMDNFTYQLVDNVNGNSLAAMASWANAITVNGNSNQVKIQDIATANQGHPLNANLEVAIIGNMYPIASGDNFFTIAAIYAITPSMLILQNGKVPGILAPQTINFNGNTYAVKPADTMEAVATGLQTTLPALAADPEFQKTALLEANVWLIISAAVHTAKNDDTFTFVATTVYSVDTTGLLMQNQAVPGLFIAGNSFVYNGTTYPIVPGDTLTSMAANLSDSTKTVVTPEDLAGYSQVQSLNIQPLGQVLIQPFNYTTASFTKPEEADTLAVIASKFSTTPAVLASNYANQQFSNLFYSGARDFATANVPGLKYLDVTSILQYFATSGSYGQLSGMVSRYQLHGMRLPTSLPGLTLSAGSPCPADGDCALFSLTGQQFALPADVAAGFKIELTNSALPWLLFDGVAMSDPNGGVLTIALTEDDITQISTLLNYAQKTGVQPKVLELAQMEPFNLLPVQYTFQTATKWQTSGELTLPYGSLGTQNSVSPVIWAFPSGMLRQIALPKVAGSKFDIQIGQYDAANGIMNYNPSSYYGWNTMVEIEIKRLAGETTALVNAYTYELMGADEAGALLLQRLLMALDPDPVKNNKDKITDIQWLYEGGEGLLSVGMASMKSFIVQANLSTETNPARPALKAMALVAEEPETDTGILNSTYDFIRLLWECSITRSGGYYLLYNEIESNAGFPDSIFSKGDTATIRLMVTYSDLFANIPSSYMNCAVTGDKIDIDSCVVYAESAVQEGLTFPVENSSDTLASVTLKYNILLSELAALNAEEILNTTVKPIPVITLDGLVYEAGRQGLPNSLDTIVSYYNVDAAKVRELNPGITDWNNLSLWQLVNIPTVNYTVSGINNTLSKVAAYYFIDMSKLAWAAKDVSNLFPILASLKINDQVLYKTSSVPQGTAGFELMRESSNPPKDANPPKVTDTGYAENYLNNLYNLLSYQVVGNASFNESIIGLPVGPVNNTPDSTAPWVYNQVVPVAKFTRPNPFMKYPEGYPQETDNPYRGIGYQAQVHFDWVDYYGNNTVTPLSDPSLLPGAPLNNPPIEMGYTDELKGFGKWPSLEMSYSYGLNTSKAPELVLEFNFNNKRYVPIPDVPGDQQQDWKKNASNDLAIYINIYYQLTQLSPENGGNTLTITLSSSLTPSSKVNIDPSQQLLDFVKSVYTYLLAVIAAADGSIASSIPVPVMAPIKNAVNITNIDTKSILQLSVVVEFMRDLAFVDTDFKDSLLVTNSPAVIKPKTYATAQSATGADDAQHSLNGFATDFEAAFFSAGNYELKIAIGTNNALAGSSGNQAVYVVRMGLKAGEGIYWNVTEAGTYELTDASIALLKAAGVPDEVTAKLSNLTNTMYNNRAAFDTALQNVLTATEFDKYRITIYTYSLLNPVFYAPKPLATSLISKNGVPICRYVTGVGLDCQGDNSNNFTGIDMDNWAAQSLNAIDLFLTSDYSVPAFLVDHLKADDEKVWLAEQGIDADTFLEAITDAKKNLAQVISGEIEPVLTAPYVANDGTSQSLANAKKQFEQQLLSQLSNAYNINALVQLKLTALSDFKGTGDMKTPPRLYGVPFVKPSTNLKADGTNDSSDKDYSVSTAKVQLSAQGAADDSYLTFSFTTKNAADSKNIPLDMAYAVTHIEFEISDVPGIEGYQGSNWLTFIISPLAKSSVPADSVLQHDLGVLDIPIVLRNYPSVPTLTTQVSNPVPAGNVSTKQKLENASQWDYVYAYTETQVAQDKIFSEIEFNLIPPPNLKMLTAGSRDLFNDMAQLINVWGQVLQDFNTYLTKITADSTNTDKNLENAYYAIQTFVTLTNNLSIAWSQFNGDVSANPNDAGTKRVYDFIVEQEPDIDYGDRLLVTIVPQEDISPADLAYFNNNSSTDYVDIPNVPYVTIEGFDTVSAKDKSGTIIPNAYWFLPAGQTSGYLSWDAARNIPSRSVNTNGLNVLQFQYAWAGLSIIRNEDLVLYNPTVSDFIYRTPLVKFSNKLVPLLSNDDVIDIAKLTNEAGANLSLAQQLSNFLQAFFSYDELKEQLTKLSVTWNYPLINDPNNLMPGIQLPVLLATPFNFEIPEDYVIPNGGCQPVFTDADPLVCRLSNAIKVWFSQLNPVTSNAWLQFDISVFSSLSESKLPLINLKNIVLYYKNITDLK